MVFVFARDVFHKLTIIPAMQLGATFPGGTHEGDGDTLVVGHGDDGCFAIPGMTLNGDVFGIDGPIGFEVVHGAVGAPSPGPQCSPIVGLARLAFVYQANNAFSQTRAVVGLNAGRVQHGEAPTLGKCLCLPAGSRIRALLRRCDRWRPASSGTGKALRQILMITGTGAFSHWPAC